MEEQKKKHKEELFEIIEKTEDDEVLKLMLQILKTFKKRWSF